MESKTLICKNLRVPLTRSFGASALRGCCSRSFIKILSFVPPPIFFLVFSIWSVLSAHCQRMIDGLLQGSPSYDVRWQTLSLMYQRPSNKSSDRRHHPHPRHHHHLQLHTHRKLLYLEGLEKIWFCSLLRYTLNHCIQLDFFFICNFLKRYGQNTEILWLFTIVWQHTTYIK